MNTLAYQDDFMKNTREERIDGKLIMMVPRPSVDHSQVASNIYYLFARYLHGKTCRPFADGVDLYLDDKNKFVPDFMVVCDPDKVRPDGVHGTPDLVVEVLSPGTMGNDRTRKKDAYARCGVREYWIVSPGDKSVEQYLLRDGDLTLSAIYAVHPDWQLAQMSEEERAAVAESFRCILFDDLDIHLKDVFYRLT